MYRLGGTLGHCTLCSLVSLGHSIEGAPWFSTMDWCLDILSFASIALNGTLLYRTLRLPHQTTINLFLSSLFVLNIFNAVINFLARSLISSDFTALSSLKYPCFLKYCGYFFHRLLSIYILTGTASIRYLMVIKGDEIREVDLKLRPNQASLRRIRLIILIPIVNALVISICMTTVMPGFPFKLLTVKICVGDRERFSEEVDYKNLLTIQAICALTTLLISSFHLRVALYQGRHNRSHFREGRQNIATFRQTSLAAYLHIGLRMLSATLRNGGFQPWGQAFFPFLDLYMSEVESIILGLFIPLSWLMSAWQDFPQFWSSGTVAERTSGGWPWVQAGLEPRRPEHCYGNITGRTGVILVKEFGTMGENHR